MKEKVFNNLTLKILSVLFAIVLWTVIVNIYDPTTSVTISNVNVQLINQESLTNQGYAFEVVDGSKIAVYLSGPKSVITDIKSSDIVATADLSKISVFADYVDIDVKVVKDGVVVNNIEIAPRTTAVKLDIENRDVKEFNIQTDITGTPASGYAILNKSITPGVVRITGPASDVEQIAKVKAVCDVTDIKASTTKLAPVVLYDANGNEINNDKLVLGTDEVEFTVTVGVLKTVPLKCAGSEGKVADGYMLTELEADVAQVTLAAVDSSLLDGITDITIPKKDINVSGLKESTVFNINLSSYVPSGVRFISSSNVEVKAIVEHKTYKQITLLASSIKMNNLKEGYDAVISDESLLVIRVSGTSEGLSKITADNIVASVDLSNLSAGTHSVALNVSSNSDCKIEGDYKVLVIISEASTGETQAIGVN